MLDYLRVRNLGVLEDATITPAPGLTVISGETGAGKTLLLGGLRLLIGEKADSSAVGPEGDTAQADGLFGADPEVGVTRVVPKEGRSRAHLDGKVVSSDTLAQVVGGLVEIVGQHDQLSLRRPSLVLALIDDALDERGRAKLAAFGEAWHQLEEVRRRQALLGGDGAGIRRELDLVGFQAREISQSGFEPGDDAALETLASRLRNAEGILEQLSESVTLMDSVSDDSGQALSRLRKASEMDDGLADLTSEMEALAAQVAEVSTGLRKAVERIDLDPGHLLEVEDRLTLLGDLKRKYGRTLDEVLVFGQQAAGRVTELERLLADSETIGEEMSAAEAGVTSTARELSAARRRAAEGLGAATQNHLSDLSLERALVEFRLDSVEPGPSGADRAVIVFSSDSELEPGPITSVASGGELSRLVLAIRLATHDTDVETLVFDEVDAGVGGVTALAMGRKLGDLAETTQVLCVTHLPQVAAFADTHYVVEREGSTATVRKVEDEQRLEELARMLAGLPKSEAGHRAAAELLAEAGR